MAASKDNLRASAGSQTPLCPIAGRGDTRFLCAVDGYDIWRNPAAAVDFVSPAPTQAELKAYYDRPTYFEGGDAERGGYHSYDAQTDASPPWLVPMLEGIEKAVKAPAILDVGCAYGTYLGLARSRGWGCQGVEPSEHARRVALERHPGLSVVAHVADLQPQAYDLVLLLEVIEHISDPYGLFFSLLSKSAIGPHTTVVITTPNARSNDALRDPAGWAYRHPPSHLVFYSGKALLSLLTNLKFGEVLVEGQHNIEPHAPAAPFADENSSLNEQLQTAAGLLCTATGCDFRVGQRGTSDAAEMRSLTTELDRVRARMASADKRAYEHQAHNEVLAAELRKVNASLEAAEQSAFARQAESEALAAELKKVNAALKAAEKSSYSRQAEAQALAAELQKANARLRLGEDSSCTPGAPARGTPEASTE